MEYAEKFGGDIKKGIAAMAEDMKTKNLNG
jgi:hypothetical protein